MGSHTFTVICDKCNKNPDTFSMTFDPLNDVYVCIAKCHGEFDRCTLPSYMLTDKWRITECRPFRQDDKTKEFKKEETVVEVVKESTQIPLCLTYKSVKEENSTRSLEWIPKIAVSI